MHSPAAMTTQPVEPSAMLSSSMICSASTGSASVPPQHLGTMSEKKSPLRKAAMVRSVKAPFASPGAASSRNRGAMDRAFSRSVDNYTAARRSTGITSRA
jgi:hypothetical protein